MLAVFGVVAFVIAILFSIAWHELGHMIPAKKFGVKVTQYMIGFGPTIWSRKKGDTEYGVKAIPLGGYVRMIGMYPPGPDGEVRPSNTGRLATLIEDARKQSQAEVLTPQDDQRTFYRLSAPRKLVVMLGGPVMNLILAAILFTVMLVGFGLPESTLTVSRVTPCVPSAANPAGACTAGSVASPAAQAGLKPGDVITSLDGEPVSSWAQFSAAIRAASGVISVGVTRDGQARTLTADLVTIPRPVIVDGTPTGETAPGGFLGMAPDVVLAPQPVSEVPVAMWDLTEKSVVALISMPVKMVGVAEAAFGDSDRDPNGPVGIVGVSRISGEVAAADLPPSWKFAQFFGLVASLNLFLFLFNLVPLLPLDGGHAAGAIWEGVRRQIARVRGRPDPGPVDVARALPLAYAMVFLLIGMSVLLLYADVIKPIKLG